MPSFGNLFASLTLESASFMSGMKAAQKELAATQKTFAAVGTKLTQAGAIMTVGVTAPFTALLSQAVPAARESAQALAQVNAALTSMGPAAGQTSAQLQATAGHLQDISLFDDDDILKSVTANLLTFGKVTGDVFTRAEQSIVDISARMGTDLQSATIMVGKALNDPVKGMKALTRAGIQFTDAQKEQITAMVAAGNTAGAQSVMLGELERQFGGAAKAQRDATPTAAMDQAWRTLQETVGGVAMQVLPNIANGLAAVLNAFNQLSPGMQTTIVATAAVAAALGPVIAAIGSVVTVGGLLLPALVAIGGAMATLAGAIVTTAIPAAAAFIVAMSPILLPLAAIAGAVALVVASVRHWDEIKAIAGRVIGYMASLYNGAKDWLAGKLVGVLNGVFIPIKKVGDAFFNLYDRVVGHSYVPDMVDEIGQHMARLDGNMVAPVAKATQTAAQAFADLASRVQPLLDRLFPDEAKFNKFKKDMADLSAVAAAQQWSPEQLTEAQRRLRNDARGADPASDVRSVDAIQAPIDLTQVNEAGKAISDTWSKIGAANDNLRDSFADTMRSVSQSIAGLAQDIKSGDWLSALTGVLDIVQQLGRVGAFGKGFQANVKGLDGARAAGGPVMPGGSYLVGEHGPEILRMGGAGGSVVPNHEIGSSIVEVHVVANDYFDARVGQVSGGVSARAISGAQRQAAISGRQRLDG